MKPRTTLLTLGLLAVLLPAAGAFRAVVGNEQPAAPRGRQVPAGAPIARALSCATAPCHDANGPAGSRGSEYATWVRTDPHAKAFEVLKTRQSDDMVRLLLTGRDAPPAAQYPLCLQCHSHPGAAEAASAGGEGIGCASCHGPAERWIDAHYKQGITPEEKAALGMTRTKDLPVRAEVCVRCHVGTAEAEVNHDLIAAGHPALRFEFSAYHANLPPHWNVEEDRARHQVAGKPSHFDVDAWSVGQLVAAKASLDLLAHRARPGAGTTWPELAEYQCFDCHHDLKSPSWRQQREPGKRGLGAPSWGSWYPALLPAATKAPLEDGLTRLRKEMNQWAPSRAAVRKEASAVATSLRAAEPVRGPEHPGLPGKFAVDDWDSASQAYLLLTALQRGGRGERHDSELLKGLMGRLQFPMLPKSNERLNSPTDFDPAGIRRLLDQRR